MGIMSDLNCAAYQMPLELGRKAFASPEMFRRGGYGAVAYVNGQPVSTAAVLFDSDCLNVVCVATPEHHRRRGYAEATMRHVLAEGSRRTGLSRTVLHATPDGFPERGRPNGMARSSCPSPQVRGAASARPPVLGGTRTLTTDLAGE